MVVVCDPDHSGTGKIGQSGIFSSGSAREGWPGVPSVEVPHDDGCAGRTGESVAGPGSADVVRTVPAEELAG